MLSNSAAELWAVHMGWLCGCAGTERAEAVQTVWRRVKTSDARSWSCPLTTRQWPGSVTIFTVTTHHCRHHRRCQKIVLFICVIALSFPCSALTVCGFPVLLSYCPWLSGAPLLLSVAFRCLALTVRGFPVLRSCCLWLSGAPLLLSVAFRCSALAVCGFPALRSYCLWLSDAPLLLSVAFRCSAFTACGFPVFHSYSVTVAFPV